MATCIELPDAADKPAKSYLVSTAKIVAAAVTYLYEEGDKKKIKNEKVISIVVSS